MFKTLTIFVFLFLGGVNLPAQSANTPLLIGRVAHNQDKIAFTYAGKIWLVDKTGGAAKRLTRTDNEETNPIFSPDGKQIAFSRLNGGDWDVYVIPADENGEARRITLMPENDFLVAWTPDGRQDFDKMEVRVNPPEEWRQIFHESIRIMRDWFYDPNYHGQNLKALENYYAQYLPTTTRRSDLNSLMGRMLGSVSASHFGIGGGASPYRSARRGLRG